MTQQTTPLARLPHLAAVAMITLTCAGCGATRSAAPAAPEVVRVALTSPAGGTVTSADHVTVRGTVTPSDAEVLVQGRPATVGNGVFVARASLRRGRTTIDVIAAARDATPASTSVAVSRPRVRKARPTPRTTTTTIIAHASVPAAGTACGNGLTVGPNTTCPFAENVRAAYRVQGPGTVMAYSPVTRRTYAMTCSSGSPVVCTGGNAASVYFA